ncbi:MAG: ABC transporter ATP-binding protein [Planctomycetes bacterium]|nr:ABC transporter ATP-binding protein [Planctomycetota bacterium]
MTLSLIMAMIVAVLLSLSFVTIIPIMKVMIEPEGLHGWIDRLSCSSRYGIDFYAPDRVGHRTLHVVRVDKESLAHEGGLRAQDEIIGLPGLDHFPSDREISRDALLQTLAQNPQQKVVLQVRRPQVQTDLLLTLHTPFDVAYVDSLNWSPFRKARWHLKLRLIHRAQWAASFLPRDRTADNRMKAIVSIVAIMMLVILIRCLAKFIQTYIGQRIVYTALSHLRQDLFTHLVNLPLAYFIRERPSDSISRLLRDTIVIGEALKLMLGKAFREPLNASLMLSFAILLNWQLTLIFLVSGPFVLILVSSVGKKTKRASHRRLGTASQMLGKLQETVAGLKVIKVYNQQSYEQETFQTLNRSFLKQQLKIALLGSATSPAVEVIGMAVASAGVILGAHWVTREGGIDGSVFLALLALLGAAAEAARKSCNVWIQIQNARAASERVFALLDQSTEREMTNARDLPPLSKTIEFQNVCFSYPGVSEPVLKGIDLAIQAGQKIAIVGPNGSGKTTLISLLPRFYDPDSGNITIDGRDICKATLASLREQISMVTQDLISFNDTVGQNIAYGKPGANTSEIIRAAQQAFAHEFIQDLPHGYDTVLGEQGSGLSGGQLQRIVIARAIIKNPSILIFDEATSQVDADSEAKIHAAIESFMKDRTTLIVAHRFSTVVAADFIVVLDQGQLIAQGRHEELYRHCKLYQDLYKTQLMGTEFTQAQ